MYLLKNYLNISKSKYEQIAFFLKHYKHPIYLSTVSYSKNVKLENNLSYSSNSNSSVKYLIGQTVGQSLNKMAIEKPNDICFKFCLSQTTFTFKELKQRVDEFAQNLLSLGFIKGDRLGNLK